MKIYCVGDEILNKVAEPVKNVDSSIKELSREMIETMHKANGIGLAAPQVGLSLRMFVTDVENDNPRVFINPQIIKTSIEENTYEEGCLSVPGIWAEVKRPAEVTIQAYNEKGNPFTLEARGVLARCIQHEYDHLNGILFINKVDEKKREKILSDRKPFFIEADTYRFCGHSRWHRRTPDTKCRCR